MTRQSLARSRVTAQRQAVLDELRRVCSHPTAEELYRAVRKRIPRISLGTVYRNLQALSRAGLARKLAGDGSRMRFDGRVDEHIHVRCSRCGRVDDVEVSPVPDLSAVVTGRAGYRLTGCRLEYVGVCAGCKEDSRSPKRRNHHVNQRDED